MSILFVIFFFVLGTIIGSFLNVVIYRYNTGLGIDGRSQCFSCGKTLEWYELIPLVSYLIQRGKCRECKSTISSQYFFVEMTTGLLFLSVAIKYQALALLQTPLFVYHMIFTLVVFSLYIVVFVYDLKHKIIPDSLSLATAVITFIGLFISTTGTIHFALPALGQFLAGILLPLPFAMLWLISKGAWMGLGDAKLAVSMGWFLGLIPGISALILAFWIGAAVGLLMIFVQRLISKDGSAVTMKTEIPFAPFLLIGLLIVFFTSVNVLFI